MKKIVSLIMILVLIVSCSSKPVDSSRSENDDRSSRPRTKSYNQFYHEWEN